MKGIFLLHSVFETKVKARVPLCLEHMELGQQHSSTGQGHMVPAWYLCWAMGLGYALCLSPATSTAVTHGTAVSQTWPECGCSHPIHHLGLLQSQNRTHGIY